MKNNAIFNIINGIYTLNCSRCGNIIKSENSFTHDEIKSSRGLKFYPKQYCDKCINFIIKNNECGCNY